MNQRWPQSIDDVLSSVSPAVAVNSLGVFTFVNKSFEESYEWNKNELIGNPLVKIIPKKMQEAHNIGFSRFIAIENPRILNQPLELDVLCGSGKIVSATHYIISEKKDGQWEFGAIIVKE